MKTATDKPPLYYTKVCSAGMTYRDSVNIDQRPAKPHLFEKLTSPKVCAVKVSKVGLAIRER